MPFADITGHERIIEVLRRSVISGKVPHAYIFEGICGIGRRLTAMSLLQAVFCRAFDGDACGICPSCRKIAGGNHGDIHLVEPLPDKRDISIDQLREMQRELSLRPYEAPRKACIVEPAERMSTGAANSLLKTLEEPPGNALLILITENADMLLPTIRSRCQLIRFSPLPPEHLCTLLVRNGLSPDQAGIIAPFSDGSVRKALESDSSALEPRRAAVMECLTGLNDASIMTVFDASETLGGSREDALSSLDLMIGLVRNTIHFHAGHGDGLSEYDRRAVESVAMRIPIQKALQILDDILFTRRAIHRNANSRLALDCLFMRLAGSFS